MTTPYTATRLAAPNDNLFGICARVGEDFGFDPLWLRLAFAVMLVLDPVMVIGGYFALGAAVLLSRVLFPQRGALAPAPVTVPVRIREHAAEELHLPLAA